MLNQLERGMKVVGDAKKIAGGYISQGNKYINMIFGIGGTTVGALSLDALLEEGTDLSASVTQYAVEDGTPISDHIGIQSETLKISGVVSGASVVLFGEAGKSKLTAAKNVLREIHEKREPITITTGLEEYKDYAMTACSIRRGTDGEKLDVELQFTKIRKAKTREADIPPEKVKANAKGKAGETKQAKGKATTKPPRKGKMPASVKAKSPASASKAATKIAPSKGGNVEPYRSQLKSRFG